MRFKFTFASLLMLSLLLDVPSEKVEAAKSYIETEDVPQKIAQDKACYITDRPFEKSPNSFEAWIKLPRSLNDDKYGGTIMSNYISHTVFPGNTSWEVYQNGHFRVYWNYQGSRKAEFDHVFESYDLRTDEWEHVALVRNPADSSFSFYVNGSLKEKVNAETTDALGKVRYNIGTDWTDWGYNTIGQNFLKNPFMGEIKQIAIYSDPIPASKVAEDMANDHITQGENYELLGSWTLGEWDKVHIQDLSPKGNNVRRGTYEKYINYKENEDYDYSFIAVPDIQISTHYQPWKLDVAADYMGKILKTKNLKYVTYVGDLCDDARQQSHWDVVKHHFSMLEQKGVPYGFVPGNHDYDDGGGRVRSTVMLNTNLPYDHYASLPYFGGAFYDGMIDNYYNLIDMDGVKYMFLNLEWGPRDTVLEWANRVVDQYPDHRVIVTTHYYTDTDGNIGSNKYSYPPSKYGIGSGGSSNDPDEMHEKFTKRHRNIFMVFNGHVSHDDQVYNPMKGMYGNTIHCILVDAQGSLQGDACDVLGLYKVNEAKKEISAYWYSPTTDKYLNPQSQFTFSFEDANNPTVGLKSNAPLVTKPLTRSNSDAIILIIAIIPLAGGLFTMGYVAIKRRKEK